MRKPIMLCLFVLAISILPLGASNPADQCLVIGQGQDPVKALNLFQQALHLWKRDQAARALELYESALIADRSILSQDDQGMGRALLEKIRREGEVASPTASQLCREGFFENILEGNLESAIGNYRRAVDASGSETTRKVAQQEVSRLGKERAYIRSWQQQQTGRIAAARRREALVLAQEEKIQARENRLSELLDRQAELEERLSYLRTRESENREEMLTTLQRRSRARRYYYYRDNPSPAYPAPKPAYKGPVLGPIPAPPPGGPGPLISVEPRQLTKEFDPKPLQDNPPVRTLPQTGISSELPVSPPLSEQSSNDENLQGSPEDLERYYQYRRQADEQKLEIDHVRAEIAGVERQIAEIDREIERLRAQWAAEDQ